jgi:Legume lectin domain
MNLFYAIGLLLLFISQARSLQLITEKPPPFAFFFDFSIKEPTLERLLLHGSAKLAHSSVHLSAPGASVIYNKPLSLLGNDPASGFTTHFSFSTVPANVVNFGELDFFLLPYNNGNGDSLFETNGVLQLELPPNAVSVKLVSVNKTENNIKINVGSDLIAESSGLASPSVSGQLHCVINYNGISKRMEVKIRDSKESEMMSAFLSYPVELTSLLSKETLFVGMRYSGRNLTQSIKLNSWSFSTDDGAQIHSLHSEPLDPRSFVVASSKDHPANHKWGHPWGFLVAIVFAAACVLLLVGYTIVSTLNSVSHESENGTFPVQAGYRKMLMLEGENAKGSLELEDFN